MFFGFGEFDYFGREVVIQFGWLCYRENWWENPWDGGPLAV